MNGNTNLNAIGSSYASQYGHDTTSNIGRMLIGVKKKRKSKIGDASPKQYYANGYMKKMMNKGR